MTNLPTPLSVCSVEDAFCNDKAAIQEKTRLALSRGVTEICMRSGVHPDFSIDTYCDIL